MDLKWDLESERGSERARIGTRTGGAFEEDADVDDGGADADLAMRIKIKEDYPAGTAAMGMARVHR